MQLLKAKKKPGVLGYLKAESMGNLTWGIVKSVIPTPPGGGGGGTTH